MFYAVCIITDGKDPDVLQNTLNSVFMQMDEGMPIEQILVGGNVSGGSDNFELVPMIEAAEDGRLGYMRNQLVKHVRSYIDYVIMMDDDIELQPDFWWGILEYDIQNDEPIDVLTCRIHNPDGSRYWDWARWKGPRGQELMDYDEEDYENVYLTGGFLIARKEVLQVVKWDDDRGFYQQEDIDFTERLKDHKFSIKFNAFSTVIHRGPYTQMDNIVVRKEEPQQFPEIAVGEPMRILWYSVPPWNMTGYGNQTHQYVKYLQKAGHDVRIVPTTQLMGAPNLEWNGFKILATGNHPGGFDSLLYYTAAWRPHVVVSLYDVWPMPEDVGVQIKMAGGRWLPITPVDTDPISPQVTDRLAFAHTPIAMSQFGYRQMKQERLERARYIPHGTDIQIFHPDGPKAIQTDKFVVGMVAANIGQFDRKGFQQAIEAFSLLDPDEYYFYIHTNPVEAEDSFHLSSMAKAHGVELHFPNVWQLYQGISPQMMAKIYRSFDILYMCSRGEGFGIPLIEAQACGTPVITTNFTSMTELGQVGMLIEPRDKIWCSLDSYMAFPDSAEAAFGLEKARLVKEDHPYEWVEKKHQARKFAEAYDMELVAHTFLLPIIENAGLRD